MVYFEFIPELHDIYAIKVVLSAGNTKLFSTKWASWAEKILHYVTSIKYNGVIVSTTNEDSLTWGNTKRDFKEGDECIINLDVNKLRDATETGVFFGDVFSHITDSGLTNIKEICLPWLDFSNRTNFNDFFFNFLLSCPNITTILIPAWDTSSGISFKEFYWNFIENDTKIESIIFPKFNTSNGTDFSSFFFMFLANCTNLKSCTIPLYDMSKGTIFLDPNKTNYDFAYKAFIGTTNLKDIYVPTINPNATISWTNTGRSVSFVSDVTIHHDGDWLTTERVKNLSSTGTITYDPPLTS